MIIFTVQIVRTAGDWQGQKIGVRSQNRKSRTSNALEKMNVEHRTSNIERRIKGEKTEVRSQESGVRIGKAERRILNDLK
jgi:hypothetical protein